MPDQYGYPKPEELERLATFTGTPRAYVDYVRGIWHSGAMAVEDIQDPYLPRELKRIDLVTLGFSGCETTVSRIMAPESIFHHKYWESTHRGGLYVFHVPVFDWEQPGFLGDYRLAPL